MQHSIRTPARSRRREPARRLIRRGAGALGLAAVTLVVSLGFDVAAAGPPGTVFPVGHAPDLGFSPANGTTGIARTPSGQGYWLANESGAVFAFGDAPFHGSIPARPGARIVDIAGTADGNGYWLVDAAGRVANFGSAKALGSVELPLNQPVVGMAVTPTGNGYWMAGRDGGIFAFGDARYHGSAGGVALNQPIVGMAATPTGRGYWLAARDGGIFAFGDAAFAGSISGTRLAEPVVGMAATPSGAGYWLVARDGAVFAYGDAGFFGSLVGASSAPIVGIDSSGDGSGQWVAAGGRYLGMFEVTCYSLRGRTASGRPVSMSGVAADPRVLPMGSEIYVGGEGTRTVIDTGGAIKGRRLDIWRPSASQCRAFGRRQMPVFTTG